MTNLVSSAEVFSNIERVKHAKAKAHLRGVIERRYVGKLIGHRGQNLTRISKDCNVLLSLNQNAKSHGTRILHITGLPEDCADAWYNVLKSTFPRTFSESRIGISFILPDIYINFAQYEQDNFNLFEQIASDTDTEIIIKRDFLTHSTERLVKISIRDENSLDNFRQALRQLVLHLYKYPKLVLSCPDNQFYQMTDNTDDEYIIDCMSETINNNRDTIYNSFF